MQVKNRIKEHRKVRAGDLIPHPLNFREHPDEQRQGLAASYDEIGFCRSLLCFKRPDGQLQLIDGHLRAEHDPEMEVDVEILDVTPEEADKLLLTMDPLAALAVTNLQTHKKLADSIQNAPQQLKDLWKITAKAANRLKQNLQAARNTENKFLILIECADEQDQVDKLKFLKSEDIPCRALVS